MVAKIPLSGLTSPKGERRHCKHWTATNHTQKTDRPWLPLASPFPFSLFGIFGPTAHASCKHSHNFC
jgi:hypothetical protein